MTQLERALDRCAPSRVFTVIDGRVRELHGLPIEGPSFTQAPGERNKGHAKDDAPKKNARRNPKKKKKDS